MTMKTNLLLLSFFAFSGAFSQNSKTISGKEAEFYASDKSKYTTAGTGEEFRNSITETNLGRIFFADNNPNIKTAKTNGFERHRVWLNMTNDGGAFKQILIGYIQGASNGLDSDFDGVSLDANPYIDFYSINSGTNLVIQGRALPFSDDDQVPLGYRTAITGDFTIAIDEADGLLLDKTVFIEDKHTNTIHDLSADSYTFATKAGTFKDRFVLRYRNQTLSNYDFDKRNSQVSVWIANKNINVSSESTNIKKIFVYTISGNLIYSDQSVVNNESVITNIKPNNEVLLMKIVLSDNQIETKKVIY